MSVFYDLSKTPRNILNQAIVRAIASENNGALFDPSDLSTLYQDAAGTTPVTAVEQPVGLMLDKSRWLMLGPEKWSDPASAIITNGTGSYTQSTKTMSGATSYPRFGFNLGLITGKRYVISGVLTGQTSSVMEVQTTNDTATSQCKLSYNPSTGVFYGIVEKQIVGALDLAGVLWFRTKATSPFNASISNISVRELYGYHATQSITASRPTLSARKNILLATEALATQSVTTLAAQYTLSFTGAGSVTLSGTATGTLTGTGADRVSLTFTPTAGPLTLTVSGIVTNAQVELGAVAGPYQRVTTSTDYDTDERYFKKFLRFDGVDDYLNLPYMGLYAGGSASVVVAGRTSKQWGVVISEGSTTSGSPQFAPLLTTTATGDTVGVIRDDNNGNVLLHYNTSMFDKVSVVSSIISASDSKAYRDSVFKTALGYTRSTPVTMNTTVIGARVSPSVVEFLGGNIYGLIITKSALTDSQRIACERHLSRKSGVQL